LLRLTVTQNLIEWTLDCVQPFHEIEIHKGLFSR